MIGAQVITVDFRTIDVMSARVRQAPSLLKKAVKSRVRKVRVVFKAEVQAPDNLPALPFIWSSDPVAHARARRWWFAHLKRLGILTVGGRYQRTGALVKAWDMTTLDEGLGLSIAVENPAKGAEFAYGPRQVPSHFLTGWSAVDKVIEAQRDALNIGIRQDWFMVSNPFAGVTG